MVYCEAFLVSTLVFTLLFTVHSDIKIGIIENKKILISSALCLATDLIYYWFFAQKYFSVFILNLIFLSAVSVILYAYNIWAAGDCKLMINVLLAIPGRFYFFNYKGVTPGFMHLVIIFAFAFVYIICESIFLLIYQKGKHSVQTANIKFNWKNYLKSFATCLTIIFSVNGLLTNLLPAFFSDNSYLLLMITFLVVLTVMNFSRLQSLAVIITATAVCISLVSLGIIPVHIRSINYIQYLLMFALIFLRFIGEKHNYKEIQTTQVKQGMILSLSTIIRFSSSRVDGLPLVTTEDLRSRLTIEEVNSILLWGASAYGSPTVVIVRKIPFAVFITIGTLAFMILELI